MLAGTLKKAWPGQHFSSNAQEFPWPLFLLVLGVSQCYGLHMKRTPEPRTPWALPQGSNVLKRGLKCWLAHKGTQLLRGWVHSWMGSEEGAPRGGKSLGWPVGSASCPSLLFSVSLNSQLLPGEKLSSSMLSCSRVPTLELTDHGLKPLKL